MQNPLLVEDAKDTDRKSSGDPTIAVAFGGGGARGMAHIHVIEVLDELGIRPVAISGASIGAIMGASMAAGLPGRDIRDYALATLGRRSEIVSRVWRLRPSRVGGVMAGGFRVGQFNIERILAAFLPDTIPQRFEDLSIPLQVVTTDFYAQQESVCRSGDLRNAIAASSAIPAIFRPVLCNGRYMIDGGIFNPVPYDHLTGLADIVIGIDVVGGPSGDDDICPSTVDLLFGASQLMMQSIISMKLRTAPPDIFLRPDVSQFRVLDFLRAQDVLRASSAVRDELKHAIDAIFAFYN